MDDVKLIAFIRQICHLPDELHPMAQSAVEKWVTGWYAATETGYADAAKAFMYHVTVVQSDNFAWVGCVVTFAVGQ